MTIKVVESPFYDAPMGPTDPQIRNGINYPKINGNMEIANGTIFASALVVGEQTWIHNITWTATDFNTASWSSGTMTFPDGTTYSIDSGNTGNIAAKTYVYFDKTSTLKTTTTYSDAIGSDKILLAIVELGVSPSVCLMTIFGATGTTIDGDKIVTGRIQSTDGKTYFDLDSGIINVNDGTNDRVRIGVIAS